MTSCRRPSATLPTSPKATSKPRGASVDTALALDKIPQRLIQVLVFRGVPQNAGPFAARAVIDLFRIGSATSEACEGFCLSDRRIPSQVQRPMSTVDCPTLQSPRHDGFENDVQ